jgi:hypothetical protein
MGKRIQPAENNYNFIADSDSERSTNISPISIEFSIRLTFPSPQDPHLRARASFKKISAKFSSSERIGRPTTSTNFQTAQSLPTTAAAAVAAATATPSHKQHNS